MKRAIAIATLLLLAPHARAGDNDEPAAVDTAAADAPSIDPHDLRGYLRAQVAARWAVADKTAILDTHKLDDRADERARRARAAYKLLRANVGEVWIDPDERMAAARRRAAARHVLATDRAEVGILADELTRVVAARARLTADLATAELVPLPATASLAWPARGDVARHFGTLVHDDSRATLSRHGLDLDTDDHAEAHAVADGVVRYAGPIRGLDDGVVIDHGGFVSVIAKLGPPTVRVGDRVHQGDTVGAAARHRVYLELRLPVGLGGTPVDPEPLLAPR